MRLYRVLMTPWVATHRSARWMFALVLTSLAVVDVLGHIYGLPRHAQAFSAIMVGIGNAACWLLLMPNLLWLVFASRRMRVPGITSDASWSLLVYAVLGIGMPVLCQFPQGHVLSFAIVQVLVAAGAMLYMALPAYVGVSVFILPALFGTVRRAFSLPGLTDPRLVLWGELLAALLVALLAWRWAQLLRGDFSDSGLHAPTVITLRRRLWSMPGVAHADSGLVRARSGGLKIRPQLHDVGPQQPIRSLRIALGGLYLPQTIIGRLRRFIPAVVILVLVGLIFLAATFNAADIRSSLHYAFSRDGFRVASWMFAVFALGIVLMPVDLLTLRWGRVNGELSLLALLPGLDQSGRVKRLLLRASIQRPAMLLGGLLLAGWLGAISFNAGWPVALAMLAVSFGCLGYLSAMTLCIFGGHPLSAFGRNLLLIGMLVLLSFTMLSAQWSVDWSALVVTNAENTLGVAWLVLVVLLLWLARRGWSGLQKRAHPFFPTC